jgi:hypothetical protein
MQKKTAMKYVRAMRACHRQAITVQFPFSMIAILMCAIQGAGAHSVAFQARDKAAQQQTIKVKTELVEVRAVVTDRKGRPIENLGKDDFELLVNRKPQPVDHFSFTRIEDAPAPPAGAGAAAGGTEPKSLLTRLTEPPVRTVLLYVDNLHLSFSSLVRTKQALRKFVDERLTEQDWQPAIASAKDSKGITITGHMSLAGLPSGIYELRLTAREPQSKRLYQRAAFLGIEGS